LCTVTVTVTGGFTITVTGGVTVTVTDGVTITVTGGVTVTGCVTIIVTGGVSLYGRRLKLASESELRNILQLPFQHFCIPTRNVFDFGLGFPPSMFLGGSRLLRRTFNRHPGSFFLEIATKGEFE
jgi:hypothetical protein